MESSLENKKDIWYIIAMLVGVVAIVIGIWFLQRELYSLHSLADITFGGDFYTEIYKASCRVYDVASNINDLVKKGIGFSFIFGGIIDICVFGSKINFASNDIGINDIATTNESKTISADQTIDTEEITSENQ